MGKPGLTLIAVLCAAVLVAACGSAGDAQPLQPTTFDPLTVSIAPSPLDADTPPEAGVLRLAGVPSVAMGLVRAAGAYGVYGQEGVALRIDDGLSSPQIDEALRSGALDGAVVTTDQALALREAGVPIRVVLLLTSSTTDDVVVAREDVEEIAGLAGRRVAYSPAGDAELVLRSALARDGVVPAAVTRVVDLAPAAALAAGRVDGAVLTGNEAAAAIAADPGLRVLYAAGERPGLVSNVLVVRDAIAEERPGQLLGLVRAWQDVYRIDREDPEAVAATIAELFGTSQEDVLTALEGTAIYDVPANGVELLPGGQYHDTTVADVARFAREAGKLRGTTTADQLIDPVFAQTVASAG